MRIYKRISNKDNQTAGSINTPGDFDVFFKEHYPLPADTWMKKQRETSCRMYLPSFGNAEQTSLHWLPSKPFFIALSPTVAWTASDMKKSKGGMPIPSSQNWPAKRTSRKTSSEKKPLFLSTRNWKSWSHVNKKSSCSLYRTNPTKRLPKYFPFRSQRSRHTRCMHTNVYVKNWKN